MEEITCEQDRLNRARVFRLPDGRYASFDAGTVERVGLHQLLRDAGVDLDFTPVPVHQGGRTVGTLPACFCPTAFKSKSWLYEPRPGDFRKDGNIWLASPGLGPGDLEAVPGFVVAKLEPSQA